MAQQDSKTLTIGSQNYEVRMLDPFVASDLLVEFGQLLGPALTKLAAAAAGEEDKEREAEAALDAVGSVLKDLTPIQLRSITTRMGDVSYLKSGDREQQMTENIIREHFRKNGLAEMYQWLLFALKTNFSDFFSSMAPVISQGVRELGLGR